MNARPIYCYFAATELRGDDAVEDQSAKLGWADDRLNRKEDADFLYDFLIGQLEERQRREETRSYVLNIDAKWGGGKSFFLRRFGQDLRNKGHLVAFVDAWKDDFSTDPYLPIFAAIDRAFQPFVKKESSTSKAWSAAKRNAGAIAVKAAAGAVRAAAKRYLDFDVTEMVTSSEYEDAKKIADSGLSAAEGQIERLFDSSIDKLIEQLEKERTETAAFQERLGAAINSLSDMSVPAPVFILIDELDRCRPTYAIQLLERVKHLFEVDGLVFVFATNSEQLSFSISGAYGAGFDGRGYLKRFFDRTYHFPPTSLSELIHELCRNLPKDKIKYPNDQLEDSITSGCNAFNLGPRETKRVLNTIATCLSTWNHSTKLDIMLLLPLCAEFERTGKYGWDAPDTDCLKRWVLKLPIYREYNGQTFDPSIRLGDGFILAKALAGNLGKCIDFQENVKRDPTKRYVADSFLSEWDGKSINRTNPSVQFNIPALVAFARNLDLGPMEETGTG